MPLALRFEQRAQQDAQRSMKATGIGPFQHGGEHGATASLRQRKAMNSPSQPAWSTRIIFISLPPQHPSGHEARARAKAVAAAVTIWTFARRLF